MKNSKMLSGLSIHNLSNEMLDEAMDWRQVFTGKNINPNWKSSWSRSGIQKLVEDAKVYYEYKTGQNLPYNLATHGPWVGYSWSDNLYEGDRFDSPPAEKMIEVAARFSSWLKIIADEKYVGLQRMLEKCLDYGMGAKGTCIDPYSILDVWNSPRTAENMLWKAYKRAWQVLRPFGLTPSWQVVGEVMTSSKVSHRLGKMAFAIAARTVNHYIGGGFSGSSVEILTKARGIAFLKQHKSRNERLDYASWAISRIEAGEFSCMREAFVVMESRLAGWGDGIIIDTGAVVKHQNGHMTEVPTAFSGGYSSSYFIFAGQTISGSDPVTAWQKFMAAEVIRRRYNIKVDTVRLDPRDLSIYRNPLQSIHHGIRRAVKAWLYGHSHGNVLPFSAYKGWKKNIADVQIEAWAFGRIKAGEFRNFEEAILASARLTPDNTDGVSLLIDPVISQTIHRVTCDVGWDSSGNCQFILRQIATGRTYHVPIGWSHKADDYRGAVKKALAAWHKQTLLERKEADLVAFLRGDRGYCPLIYRNESYRAGNCQSGTESWTRNQGWDSRNFIPAEWLIPFLGESRVRNAVMIIYQDLTKIRKVA